MSVLRHQSFGAPMHVSKPHHDSDALVVNVVNATAGLLAGDRIECHVEVETGASLLLTSPCASRAHRMYEGSAQMTQRMRVAPGAFLEFWPELFIPQRGTRYTQRTELTIEGSGELLFFESLAPGRVASGEAFAYIELSWMTDIWCDAVLVARERYRLKPDGEAFRALRTAFTESYYASGFVISKRLENHPMWQRIHALHAKDSWVGCSRLPSHGWVIKVLAGGSVALRRTLQQIRAELYSALGRPAPSLRRAGVP